MRLATDAVAVPGGDDTAMHDRGNHARERDAEDGERFAIRHEQRAMEDVERRLEHELAALGETEERAKHAIEDEWRREHWGRDPERPAWRRKRPRDG